MAAAAKTISASVKKLVCMVLVQNLKELVSSEFVQDQVNEWFCGERKHQAGHAIDSYQHKPKQHQPAARLISFHTSGITLRIGGLRLEQIVGGLGRRARGSARRSGAFGFCRHRSEI